MSFWDDVVRAGAAVATGGMSEAVLDAAGGTHETAAPPFPIPPGTIFPGGAGLAGPPRVGPKQGESTSGCGCARYELKPPFLLNNTTGDVWIFDEDTKHFQKVEVERHRVAKTIENLVAAKVTLDLRAKLDSDGLLVNRAQYAKLAPFVDQTVKALDMRLEEMMRS